MREREERVSLESPQYGLSIQVMRIKIPQSDVRLKENLKKGRAEKFVPNTVLRFFARMFSFLGPRFPNEKTNELNEMRYIGFGTSE